MKKDVVEAKIKGVMPTSNGCAVFLGPDARTFVIYVDASIGAALQAAAEQSRRERPLTHDLMSDMLLGLGVELDHVVINDVEDGVFYARILLRMENEVARKIIELDARPSDSMVLALQAKRPIFVAQKVLDATEDMTEILERIQRERAAREEEG
jgi:uncharacterized protein